MASQDQEIAALFPTMAKPEAKPQAAPAADDQATIAALFPTMARVPRVRAGASDAEKLFPTMKLASKPGDQQQQSPQQSQQQQEQQQSEVAKEISAALSERFEDLDFDHPAIQAFTNLAADLDLPVEDCAKLIEMHEATTIAENVETALAWQEEWEARPNAAADLEVANNVLRAYGSDDLRSWLRESVTGRNPELIEFMSNVGRALGFAPVKRR